VDSTITRVVWWMDSPDSILASDRHEPTKPCIQSVAAMNFFLFSLSGDNCLAAYFTSCF
jgi:hypothetical protein